MAHLSDEDAIACGIVRKDDTGWEPAARVLGTVGVSLAAMAVAGPVGFVAAMALITKSTYDGRDKD